MAWPGPESVEAGSLRMRRKVPAARGHWNARLPQAGDKAWHRLEPWSKGRLQLTGEEHPDGGQRGVVTPGACYEERHRGAQRRGRVTAVDRVPTQAYSAAGLRFKAHGADWPGAPAR